MQVFVLTGCSGSRRPRPLTPPLLVSPQYGGEEVCSDRLDADFPDIDLSQLDTSDFDSVNCLGELQWCSDQQADASPASTADELFEVRPTPLNPAHSHHGYKESAGGELPGQTCITSCSDPQRTDWKRGAVIIWSRARARALGPASCTLASSHEHIKKYQTAELPVWGFAPPKPGHMTREAAVVPDGPGSIS